ncbi:MAG: gliding motility lipoprotein GldH [Vicingaceae bacterium]
MSNNSYIFPLAQKRHSTNQIAPKVPLKQVVVIAFLTIFMLESCDSSRIYEQNQEIDGAEWAEQESKEFVFSIDNTEFLYNVYINVRNKNEYAYNNLFLFIEMTAPDEKFFADTIEFTLADKSGRWTGTGIGNTWQNQFALLKGVKILIPGEYKVTIRHGMRQDTLNSISDVGLRVEKVGIRVEKE